MTIQNIIDTYNYAAVTGCRLTKAASENLCSEIMKILKPYAKRPVKAITPVFTEVGHGVPEDFATFTGYKVKTQSLYGNYAELELLRILYTLKPEAPMLGEMLMATKERLAETCFGQFCGKGECFEVSIITLRFMATVFPEESLWVDSLINGIATTIRDRKRKISKRSILMFCQVISEMRRARDGVLMDEMLWYVDGAHLHNISRVSAEIIDCILYSGLRRSVLAS